MALYRILNGKLLKLTRDPGTKKVKRTWHKANTSSAVFSSDVDMVAKDRTKYELVSEDDDAEVVQEETEEEARKALEAEARAEYEAMNVDALKDYAEANEIELNGATRKAEIIDAIMAFNAVE